MKLDNISEINMGLVLSRRKITLDSKGKKDYKAITIKSIDEYGIIDMQETEKFNSIAIIEDKYLTKEGDIIIRLASPFTAICIDDKSENMVVSSQFAKIRLNSYDITPMFLALYLNSSTAKNQILKNASGTSLTSITLKDIKNINIKPYKINLQNKVIKLNELHKREKQLLEKLIKEKEKLNVNIINELLTTGGSTNE